MRKLISALILALLCVVSANAELGGQQIAAVETSQTFTINKSSMVITNDGSGEIYVRVFYEGETPAAAVANSSTAQIKSNESFNYKKDFNIIAVSIVCAAGETATVRLQYF